MQLNPKILLYSHDTFGLGNIRRTLLLAEALREAFADAAILIVTGSPVIHAFRIPEGIDYVKLPCLDRIEAERYEPRFFRQWSSEVTEMRRTILSKSILGFAPDLMIVDKRPAGIDNELLETLKTLKARGPKTKLILGVRDILDEPERTRRSLLENSAFDLIERFYDEVWIYGTPEIFDHVRAYAYPPAVARKTHYVGYLQRPTLKLPTKEGPPRVLVTTGGGGDGGTMIETYLEGLLNLPRRVRLKTTVMFGPQMPDGRREDLLARYGTLVDVKFRDFAPDLTPHYAKADLVVSMAGYNTVCELLSFGKRAVLVPRAEPVKEQLIRARTMSEQGFFEMVEPAELSPEGLMSAVLSSLEQAKPMPAIDLGGLPTILRRVWGHLEEAELCSAVA